jgi:glc operon protein GlcG
MLTLAEANQAIAAALARAQNMKMKIAVSVCDEGGHLVAFQRMDGAFFRINCISNRKSHRRGSFKKVQRR